MVHILLHPKLRVGLIYFSLLITYASSAQNILWEKSYGGIHAEYLFDVQPTLDNGFILAGSSLSGVSGTKTSENIKDLDYWLWKMDERGDLEWQRSFGGEGTDMLVSVQVTKEGGFILAGNSTSPKGIYKKEESRGQEDIWVIKLQPDGTEQWQKTIGGSGKDIVKQVVETRDGGYVIGGSSSSPASNHTTPDIEKTSVHYGNLDYWVVKLSSSGEVEWEKTYGGKYKDQLEAIALTQDEGYIIGGYSNSPVSDIKEEGPKGEGGDYWILRLDKNGEVQWQLLLGGEGDDHLYEIIQAKDGGYLVGGSSSSPTDGIKTKGNGKGIDFWVIKLTDYGAVEWQETYDIGQTDVLTTIVENEDGTLLLGGYAQSETVGQKKTDRKGINDYVAIKINDKGEELWRTTVGSSGAEVLRKLIETRDGSYVLAGTSRGGISRDKNSHRGRSDFWVVRLGDEDKDDKPGRPGLEAYPNPTTSYTNVLVNHEFESGSATLYDIGGRQLQHFNINSRTVPVNLQNYPTGVYIINIKTNVKTEAVKVIRGIQN